MSYNNNYIYIYYDAPPAIQCALPSQRQLSGRQSWGLSLHLYHRTSSPTEGGGTEAQSRKSQPAVVVWIVCACDWFTVFQVMRSVSGTIHNAHVQGRAIVFDKSRWRSWIMGYHYFFLQTWNVYVIGSTCPREFTSLKHWRYSSFTINFWSPDEKESWIFIEILQCRLINGCDLHWT